MTNEALPLVLLIRHFTIWIYPTVTVHAFTTLDVKIFTLSEAYCCLLHASLLTGLALKSSIIDNQIDLMT